jgi:hypothetical protein
MVGECGPKPSPNREYPFRSRTAPLKKITQSTCTCFFHLCSRLECHATILPVPQHLPELLPSRRYINLARAPMPHRYGGPQCRVRSPRRGLTICNEEGGGTVQGDIQGGPRGTIRHPPNRQEGCQAPRLRPGPDASSLGILGHVILHLGRGHYYREGHL